MKKGKKKGRKKEGMKKKGRKEGGREVGRGGKQTSGYSQPNSFLSAGTRVTVQFSRARQPSDCGQRKLEEGIESTEIKGVSRC